MNTRERWIVYPLLFLALGLALRDKIVPQSELIAFGIECAKLKADEVTCTSVTVTDPSGNIAARIVPVGSGGGRLEIHGATGNAVVVLGADQSGQFGAAEFADPDGTLQLLLQASKEGGRVTTFDPHQTLVLLTGYMGSEAGMFALLPGSKRIHLTKPLQFVKTEVPPTTPEQPPENDEKKDDQEKPE